jgi:hypothetical protein
VLKIKDRAGFSIAHYSTSAGDLLRLSRTQGTTERIVNEDIFKVLAERSPSSSSVMRSYKKAVSLDIKVVIEEKARSVMPTWPVVKTEERLISHWTPCKDEEGRAKYVVLILAEERDL